MRRKHQRTPQAIFAHPVRANIQWRDIEALFVEGYQAKIAYDAELDMFRGEIHGLNGGADFYERTPEELRTEFRQSLHVFLEVCREKGVAPRRHYAGKFNIRIPPELHERLAMLAEAEGKSLNALAQEALQRIVE